MIEIHKYKATDGSEWKSASEAIHRDRLHAACLEAMLPLGDVPEQVKKGKGWVQHDLEVVKQCKDQIIELCREEGFDKSWDTFKNRGRDIHLLSIVGRILDDHGGPLNTAWIRF